MRSTTVGGFDRRGPHAACGDGRVECVDPDPDPDPEPPWTARPALRRQLSSMLSRHRRKSSCASSCRPRVKCRARRWRFPKTSRGDTGAAAAAACVDVDVDVAFHPRPFAFHPPPYPYACPYPPVQVLFEVTPHPDTLLTWVLLQPPPCIRCTSSSSDDSAAALAASATCRSMTQNAHFRPAVLEPFRSVRRRRGGVQRRQKRS